ncbi:MAG TPA: hypothetical protein VGJ02_10530, partial [Pyrinomonadaceae bacterium]
MTKSFSILVLAVALYGLACAQTTPIPTNLPAKSISTANTTVATRPATPGGIERGTVSGQTYTNKSLSFDVTFP